jgi:hypothetical protein
MQEPYQFIGFDGWTGSMQPAYQDATGTVFDGFLYPVEADKLQDFIGALFDRPIRAGKEYKHSDGMSYRCLSVDGDVAVLESVNPGIYGEPKQPFQVIKDHWSNYHEVWGEEA